MNRLAIALLAAFSCSLVACVGEEAAPEDTNVEVEADVNSVDTQETKQTTTTPKKDTKQQDYLVITLKDVIVSSY